MNRIAAIFVWALPASGAAQERQPPPDATHHSFTLEGFTFESGPTVGGPS